MSNKQTYTLLLVILLVGYGIFKIHICQVFSTFILTIMEPFGLTPADLLATINRLSRSISFKDPNLGWLIYYPSCLFFHLILIWVLFKKNILLASRMIKTVLTTVALLVLTISISKFYSITWLYFLAYSIFQKLFGMPFILLTVKGGEKIYHDIERLINKKNVIQRNAE